MIAASLAAVTLFVPGSARATAPGPVGRIAFDDFLTGQIYATNPDGGALVQLSDLGRKNFASDPDWTVDGTHVLYSVTRSDFSKARIWIVKADGTGEHQLSGDAPGFRDDGPAMTPNGRFIVFARCEPDDGVCAIWRMRSDGTHKRALTPYQHSPNEAIDFSPAVSGDGTQIAFSRFAADAIRARVFVMGIDGSDPHPVTAPRLVGCDPDWAPDGGSVLFLSRCTATGLNAQVYTAAPNGSGVAKLTHDPYPNGVYDAVFSGDGSKIAFSDDRRYDDFCCADLFVMNADGSGQHRVPTGDLQGVLDLSWGPAPLEAALANSHVAHSARSVGPAALRNRRRLVG